MELLNTRCGQGKLIITETHIIIERLGKSQSMPRTAETTLDMRTTMWAGPWSWYTLIFHGAGQERMKASLVMQGDARAIKELLTGR